MAKPDYHVKQKWIDNLLKYNQCHGQYYELIYDLLHWILDQYNSSVINGTASITWSGLPVIQSSSSADSYSQCQLYKTASILEAVNATILAAVNATDQESCQNLFNKIESHVIGSENGIEYFGSNNGTFWYDQHKSGMKETVVTEFNLVCDKEGMVRID